MQYRHKGKVILDINDEELTVNPLDYSPKVINKLNRLFTEKGIRARVRRINEKSCYLYTKNRIAGLGKNQETTIREADHDTNQ